LAFTDLSRRREHYRRCRWLIATSYDIPSSHRQRPLLIPPSSEDNDDDDDDDNEYNKNTINGLHDYDSDGNRHYNYDDLDNDADDDDNADDDKEEEEDDDDEENKDDHEHNDDVNEDKEDSDDDDEEDSDDEDSDDDDEDSDDDEVDDLSHDDAASNLECLRTQLSIVQQLIVVLGPQFQVSYSPVSRPDYCEVTTLQDCIGRQAVFCQFCLVDVPSVEALTFIRSDCRLEGFRLSL